MIKKRNVSIKFFGFRERIVFLSKFRKLKHIPVPENGYWLDSWKIVESKETGKNGWIYAGSFETQTKFWSRKPSVYHVVRFKFSKF